MTTSNSRNYCQDLARNAQVASRILAVTSGDQKNRFLGRATEKILDNKSQILQANAADLARAAEFGLTAAQIDRLKLTSERIQAMADGLQQVIQLPDPIGQVIEESIRPNGLEVRKIRVPLGVIFFIYESRPNVTADAAALAVKSGNAIILRGGKEAMNSNQAIHAILQEALMEAGLPADAVQMVTTPDRDVITQLLKLNQYIDLAIPRGGEGLIRLVAEQATMPVLKHYQGNCHIYVDRAADLAMAERILINAKCQRPGVCNATESLLVHRDVAAVFLPQAAAALVQKGVEIRGCEETRRLVAGVKLATEADFAAEFLDLILSVKVIEDLDAAIEHINRFGSKHTDAIITQDMQAAKRFAAAVDSAAVMVNASTRFNDGYELGLGAEIGISTDKFHARGPCGLIELTTYKYVVVGEGQIRQ